MYGCLNLSTVNITSHDPLKTTTNANQPSSKFYHCVLDVFHQFQPMNKTHLCEKPTQPSPQLQHHFKNIFANSLGHRYKHPPSVPDSHDTQRAATPSESVGLVSVFLNIRKRAERLSRSFSAVLCSALPAMPTIHLTCGRLTSHNLTRVHFFSLAFSCEADNNTQQMCLKIQKKRKKRRRDETVQIYLHVHQKPSGQRNNSIRSY